VTNLKSWVAGLALATLLSGCATQPIGPTVQVMPKPGKSFDVFAQEENTCKAYAQGQIAGAVDQTNRTAAGTMALGALLGAGVGAAAAGGQGAAAGAAGGAAIGSVPAADNAAAAQATIQQRYDAAYSQCMYAKGNLVPGFMPPPMASAPPPPRFDPALVMAVQSELLRIGLLTGTPDGAYGPRTRGAILDYEKIRSLPADGIPSRSLLEDLKHN
jgi:peptidoglycan hydrolase-like protein with peptidoglycan-binding domain